MMNKNILFFLPWQNLLKTKKNLSSPFQFIKLANESKNKLVDKDIIKSEILRSRNVKNIR